MQSGSPTGERVVIPGITDGGRNTRGQTKSPSAKGDGQEVTNSIEVGPNPNDNVEAPLENTPFNPGEDEQVPPASDIYDKKGFNPQ